LRDLRVEDLSKMVDLFAGERIYAWEFFDVEEDSLNEPDDERFFLDWKAGEDDGTADSLSVLPYDELDLVGLRVWFDDLEIRRIDGSPLALGEFIMGGQRWWDAFYARDLRTQGFGLFLGGLPSSSDSHRSKSRSRHQDDG
jgi:hypothetical protein